MTARTARIARRAGRYCSVDAYLEGVRQRQQKADREARTQERIEMERRTTAAELRRIEEGRAAE